MFLIKFYLDYLTGQCILIIAKLRAEPCRCITEASLERECVGVCMCLHVIHEDVRTETQVSEGVFIGRACMTTESIQNSFTFL